MIKMSATLTMENKVDFLKAKIADEKRIKKDKNKEELIPLRLCEAAWLLFVFAALATFVLGDAWALGCLGFFALAEGYGIYTDREGDTFSERIWAFVKGHPARMGLVYGLSGFFLMVLLKLTWIEVYGPDPIIVFDQFGQVIQRDVVNALHYGSALAFLGPSFVWLGIHFNYLGKYG